MRLLRRGALLLGILMPASLLLAAPSGVGPVSGAAEHSRSALVAEPGGPGRPDVWVVLLDDATVADARSMRQVWSLLTRRGVTFTRAYSSTASCCPARATLLTGQYPHNHGVLTNTLPDGGFFQFDDTPTLATRLDRRYVTGWIGKYLNDYELGRDRYVPPGWDLWAVPVDTVYHYLQRTLNLNGRLVRRNGVDSARLGGRLTRSFIRARAGRPAPYFLVTSFLAPHGGQPADPGDPARYATPYVPRSLRNTYAGPSPARHPAFSERDISDKRSSLQERPRIGPRTRTAIREANAQRHEVLKTVVRQISQTLRRLRRGGTMRDTVIVLTSDNGFLLGQHRLPAGKNSPYEPASRIPLLVSGPGWPGGATVNTAVGLQDLAPTILRAARVWRRSWTRSIDGINLRRLVGHPQRQPDRMVLLETGDNHGGYRYRGVVGRRWKLVRFHGGPVLEAEMYDLAKDPYELTSVARDPSFNDVQERLVRRLRGLMTCRGTGCHW